MKRFGYLMFVPDYIYVGYDIEKVEQVYIRFY